MALSGSANYSLNARQLVNYALRKINVLAEAEDAPAEMADKALRELNLMLKAWMKYPTIWDLTEGSVSLIANTASYNLAGTDTTNPYRVIDCRYRTASSIDVPMFEMSRQRYYELPSKTSSGTPTQWYFDPQRSTSTLYVWPVKSTVTTESIQFTYQRRFNDCDSLSDDIDVTQESLDVVGYNLASRLADDFGRAGPAIDRIIQRAGMMLEELQDADRPEFIQVMPDWNYRYG